MKKRIVSSLALVLAALTVCLFAASCGGMESALKKYNTAGERYDYDLSEYITVPNYKGIEIPDLVYTPTSEKVAATRYKKLAYFSEEYVVKDGKVEKYDIVDCDFSCTVDGVPFDGLSSAGNSALRSLMIGIGEYDIPEIDEGIIGMAPGETKTIEFTFPTPYYRAPLYSGKTGEFTVTIEKIRRQELDDYSDEFVSKYYGIDSAEAYDAEIERQLANDYGNYLENFELDIAWDYLFSNSEMIKLPGKEYAEISDATVKSYQQSASDAGVSFEEYVKNTLGYESTSAFYDDVDAYVRRTLKEEMILYVIARCENITLSESDYHDALISFASEYNTEDIEICEDLAVKEYGSLNRFKEAARLHKIYQFVGDSAVKIDASEYYEKKAAGAYAFDPDAARGMSAVEILIIVVSAIGAALVVLIIILSVKAVKVSKLKKQSDAELAALEEKRRLRREEKKAKKKHHADKETDGADAAETDNSKDE